MALTVGSVEMGPFGLTWDYLDRRNDRTFCGFSVQHLGLQITLIFLSLAIQKNQEVSFPSYQPGLPDPIVVCIMEILYSN